MRFYRVENENGEGPYTDNAVIHDIIGLGGFDFRDHPPPMCTNESGTALYALADKGRDALRPYKFGFTSLESARWWWDRGEEALRMLHDYGFTLVVYEVNKVVEGYYQAVAILADPSVECVERLDLRTCFRKP